MKMTTAEIHDMIAGRMLTALEAGTVPWHRPWSAGAGFSGRPVSMSSGNAYRGINVWTLGLAAMDQGFSPWWGTFNRIAELSGMVKQGRFWASSDGTPRGVRKGEKSTRVVFWKSVTVADKDDPDSNRTFLTARTDSVFNACQADGLPDKYFPGKTAVSEVPGIPEPQQVLDAYIRRGPVLIHARQKRAFYQSGPDRITMPERDQFDSPEAYYETAFHEVGHSTGHPRRLNRPGVAEFDEFGSEKYGKEELAAEMTSAMLCAATGIDGTFDNSASYMASWIKAIKGDTKMVSAAASQAQAALDLVLGIEAADAEPEPVMAKAA